MEEKYQELWSQNQQFKSRDMNLSHIPSEVADNSLRDITSDMIVNVQAPTFKHQPGRFASRVSRKELLEISNSKPTHRGPYHPIHRTPSKEELLHKTLPYNLPPPPPPVPDGVASA